MLNQELRGCAVRKEIRRPIRPDSVVHIHSESLQSMKKVVFVSYGPIEFLQRCLPCFFRTCSFRGPLLLDKLAAKPPAPQGFKPKTRGKPMYEHPRMSGGKRISQGS